MPWPRLSEHLLLGLISIREASARAYSILCRGTRSSRAFSIAIMKFPLALVCLLCATPVLLHPVAGNSSFHIYRSMGCFRIPFDIDRWLRWLVHLRFFTSRLSLRSETLLRLFGSPRTDLSRRSSATPMRCWGFFFSFPPFADTFRFLEMLRDNSVNKLLQVPKIVLEDSSSFFLNPDQLIFLPWLAHKITSS